MNLQTRSLIRSEAEKGCFQGSCHNNGNLIEALNRSCWTDVRFEQHVGIYA